MLIVLDSLQNDVCIWWIVDILKIEL